MIEMVSVRVLARLGACALAALFALSPGVAPPASAQRAHRPQAAKPAEEKPAKPSIDRTRDVDFLFGALKAAPNEAAARAVEARIQALWGVSGSDTADLLMSRAKQALDSKEYDLGLELLDAVVDLNPDYFEGWNRRATLNFLKKDYLASVDDLRQVLAREPRHFGALVGLGMLMQELDEEKLALAAFRKALELHPHLSRVGELVKTLQEKVEGRGI